MSACRDVTGRSRYAKRIRLPDGRVVRIEGTAPKTSNTELAALKAFSSELQSIAKTN